MDNPHILDCLKTSEAVLFFRNGEYLLALPGKTADQWSVKFLSHETIVTCLGMQQLNYGFLKPGVVAFGHSDKGSWFLYTEAPGQREIFLEEGASTGILIPMPRLYICVVGNLHFVWATKDVDFNESSIVSYAPLPNLNASHSLCWGANRRQDACLENVESIVQIFNKAVFSGSNTGGKSLSHPGDIRDQLRLIQGQKVYPVADLVEDHNRYTVKRLLQTLT